MQGYTVKKLALVALLFGILFPLVANASEQTCKNEPPPTSISQLVTDSEFIGFYRATEIKPIAGTYSCCRYRAQLYQANFKRLNSLKGNAPEFYRKSTTFPEPKYVPISYFRIQSNHEQLVKKENVLFLWSDTSSGYSTKDGYCHTAPEVGPGYEYLIFGGVESPISVEPIIDRRADALYSEVKKYCKVTRWVECC